MDQELRDAERRARETGRVEDQGRLLVARRRAGLLDDERLALAARLGHPGAGLVAQVEPAPAPSHPWHAEVRAALARRLLDVSDPPPPPPRVVELRGPPGTNDGRRFALTPYDELLAALEGADPWEVRANYGESEELLLIRAARARFVDLADFWVQVGLRHEWFGGGDAFSWGAAARAQVEREGPVRSLDDPRAEAACGQHGFAPPVTVAGLRRLLPAGPFTRALRVREAWDDVADVLEADDAFVIAAWNTSA